MARQRLLVSQLRGGSILKKWASAAVIKWSSYATTFGRNARELLYRSDQQQVCDRVALSQLQQNGGAARLRNQLERPSRPPVLPNSWRQPIKRAARLEAAKRKRYCFRSCDGTEFCIAKSRIQARRPSDENHLCPASIAPQLHSPAGYAGSLCTSQKDRCFPGLNGRKLVAMQAAHIHPQSDRWTWLMSGGLLFGKLRPDQVPVIRAKVLAGDLASGGFFDGSATINWNWANAGLPL